MTTWTDALDGTAAHRDPEEIKAHLPLEWVLEQHGFVFTADDGAGRLIARCMLPSHAGHDEHESFAVFVYPETGTVYCGCWSCNFQGDVFDFLKVWSSEYSDFSVALRRASVLYDEFMTEVEGEPERYQRRLETAGRSLEEQKANAEHFYRVCFQALQMAHDPRTRTSAIDLMIREKIADEVWGWERLSTDGLVARWKLGTTSENPYLVLIPHLSFDPEDPTGETKVIKGYKTRTGTSKPYAYKGSDLSALYGEWLDVPGKPVILLEGESDCWTIDAWLRSENRDEVVLGLPSGASARPKDEWIARLKGRDVTLMFDGDEAGRKATRKWAKALAGAAVHYTVAQLIDGKDASSLTDAEVATALADAATLQLDQNHVHLDDVSSVFSKWVGRGDEAVSTPVCDWGFRPERSLTFPDGTLGFEGTLLPGDRQTLLTAADLKDTRSATAWSNQHGRSWLGTTQHAQGIHHYLQVQAPLLAPGVIAPVIGWHRGAFVWHTGKIGDGYIVYKPEENRAVSPDDLRAYVRIKKGAWSIEAVPVLLELNDLDVMMPILAWLAAAPLRSMFSSFPSLAIMGGSGAGKSTLIKTVTGVFSSGALESTLTGTTPHAVQSLSGASNGFPVWFDEYRNGARTSALEAVGQVIRDAWMGQASHKGGQGENKSTVHSFSATAPIIVSGEAEITERSHAERMILLSLDVNAKNPAAMAALKDLGPQTGFGHAYLTWLVQQAKLGMLPLPPLTDGKLESELLDRIDTNIWALEQGWNLLAAFCRANGYNDLPPADFTVVREAARKLSLEDPLFKAIQWAVFGESERTGVQTMSNGNGDIIVDVPTFVSAVLKNGQFILPGETAAIRKKIDTEWGADPADPDARVILPKAYERLSAR